MKQYTVKVFEDGTKAWYLDGERHREDGPAIEFSSGTKAWYLNGQKLTEEEHRLRASGVTMDDALAAGHGVSTNSKEILTSSTRRHRCELHSESGGHGEAVEVCLEDEEGKLWVENGEYASVVYFCPVCGYASRAKTKGEEHE